MAKVSYDRVNWENSPSTKTKLNATNLNKMDKGISDVVQATNEKASITYDASTKTLKIVSGEVTSELSVPEEINKVELDGVEIDLKQYAKATALSELGGEIAKRREDYIVNVTLVGDNLGGLDSIYEATTDRSIEETVQAIKDGKTVRYVVLQEIEEELVVVELTNITLGVDDEYVILVGSGSYLIDGQVSYVEVIWDNDGICIFAVTSEEYLPSSKFSKSGIISKLGYTPLNESEFTKTKIIEKLGYTPADSTALTELKKQTDALADKVTTLEKKLQANENIPSYVKSATLDLLNKVRAVQTDKTITFIAMSDAHQDDTNANIVSGNQHAGMAAKLLTDYLEPDFCTYLGDYTWGSSTNTAEEIKTHIEEVNSYIDDAFAGYPQFRTPGNHDGGAYSSVSIGSSYLYSVIGKYNEGATYGSTTEGYCYRDFESKKLRVICLNTAEGGAKEIISNTQLLWFANTLKSTPTGYGIIILSHHPLDWGNVLQASNLVYQYTNSGSVSYDGTTVSFASAGATILGAFHGHVHGFKAAKLNYISSGVGTEYDVYRIATPNMCYSRNNEYGTNGKTEYYGIEFGETTSYPKTAASATDTAFVVNVVNPETQTIHSFCYGAGYDREIYTGEQVIPVTGIKLNATSGTLAKGATVTLTATVEPSNASNKLVDWKTSSASVATVSNGVVTAVGVGSATITATTQDGGFTATYNLTVNAQSQNVLEMVGYTDGKRLSTGSGSLKDAAGYFTTGAFQIDKNKYPNGFVLRVTGVTNAKGGTFTTGNAYRDCAWVSYSDAGTSMLTANYIGDSAPALRGESTTMVIDADDHGFTWTVPSGVTAPCYIRICCCGAGADATITITER